MTTYHEPDREERCSKRQIVHLGERATETLDTPDVVIENFGSIIGITPMSPAAREWIDENCQTEPWQWLGGMLGVDTRLAGDVLQGMSEAGLTLR
jgi:hypothetical protein